MGIIAKVTGSDYIPAPAGAHAAVCVDVVDLGLLEVSFGGQKKKQHKVRIVWQIAEVRADNKPHQVERLYTLSLHEKAALRKDLESWRGRPFNEQELQGFDLETLIAVHALINVIHNVKDGSTYANVATLMRLPKGMEAPKIRDYVRVKDREPDPKQAQGESDSWSPSDDDLPPF